MPLTNKNILLAWFDIFGIWPTRYMQALQTVPPSTSRTNNKVHYWCNLYSRRRHHRQL